MMEGEVQEMMRALMMELGLGILSRPLHVVV
jgi:hypothetical protein